MKFATERKSDEFINRHKLHIFNRWLGWFVLIALSPLFFGIHLLLRSHMSHTTEIVVLFLTILVVSSVAAQALGNWIHKKPRSSKWYWLYYNN